VTVILSAEDVAAITGKTKPSAQARELEHMDIPYRTRRDGTLVVLRIHVDIAAPTPRDEKPKPRVRFD
jgi:hypothetical protein